MPKNPTHCKICGQLRQPSGTARGMCSKHYWALLRHGDPLYERVRQSDLPCTVEGCERPRKGRGWCSGHWKRWRNYGSPTGKAKPRPKRPPRLCKIEGCERVVKCYGWCGIHLGRWERTGDPMLLARFPFSPEEDRLLLALIDDTTHGVGAAKRGTLAALAIQLGRSAGSCRQRLRKLRAARRDQLTPEQRTGLEDARFKIRGPNDDD